MIDDDHIGSEQFRIAECISWFGNLMQAKFKEDDVCRAKMRSELTLHNGETISEGQEC